MSIEDVPDKGIYRVGQKRDLLDFFQ